MKAYNKQSLSELNYAGENFFHNFSAFDITDDETWWKSVESFFTDKAQTNSKITLIEKNSCFRRRARANSFWKNDFRRSGCSRKF